MKTNILIGSLIGLLGISLAGCDPEDSESVSQDRIKTHYSIDYDDNTMETATIASFWFGSTPLRLSSPAHVTANELGMSEHEILGVVDYRRTFSAYTSSVTFEYIDLDDNIYINYVQLPDSIQFPSNISKFSISEDLLINWEGEPVGTNESVQITISVGATSYSTSNTSTGSQNILIAANTLDNEFEGTAKITLKRRRSSATIQAPRSGTLSATFTSKNAYVEITP
ncbi:hypothetical protein [Marinoscillum sp. MHG1-6]|uniref:hypothetical protein n=1 Tax=Marinoscillum sp. MHG1-6 TaxID=2959627 RepID=UPI0021581AAD|nr:hypothetical protein [Marinoscillum sp. MHG1-6]